MDGNRFDSLAKAIATGSTRRRFLRGVAGGALLGLPGLRSATARSCGTPDTICRDHGDCCTGICGEKDRFGRRRCVCPPGQRPCNDGCIPVEGCCKNNECAGLTDACNSGICDQGTHSCVTQPKRNGTACDDGNRCTQTDTCQNGVCTGGDPVVCQAIDQCHQAGTCDPVTGVCSNPAKDNGAPCDDGNFCTQTDTCQQGQCVGGNLVICQALSQCHEVGTCDPSTGACSNPPASQGTTCGAPASCTAGSQHAQDTCNASGTCVSGATTSCGLYVCTGTTCRTTCANDDHCVGAAHCESGQCVNDGANGADCDANGDCTSGICNTVSSICCSQTCGSSVGCAGANFTCTPACVPNCTGKTCGDDGCSGSCGTCGANQTCNVSGQCVGDIQNGQPCGSDSACASGHCNAASGFCCSQVCASGVACTGVGFTCVTASCGAAGQTCCSGNVCNSGAHCDGGTCVANLANGAQCDEASDCQSGVCNTTSGFCCSQACGQNVACSGGGFTCASTACGETGQPCCPDNTCNVGRECDAHGVCGACGGFGQTCCAGNTCDSSQTCWIDLTCSPGCGTVLNALCCADGTCSDGMVCRDRICRQACGGVGEQCCVPSNGPVFCDAGLVCSTQGCQPECGDRDQACCLQEDGHTGRCENGCCSFGDGDEQICRCGPEGECCCTGNTCDGALVCSYDNYCVPHCGALDEPCCNERTCGNGLYCTRDHVCQPCMPNGDSASEGPCCSGTSEIFSVEQGVHVELCTPCGSLGEGCCLNACLDGKSICNPSTDTCEPCGAHDLPCCRYCQTPTCLFCPDPNLPEFCYDAPRFCGENAECRSIVLGHPEMICVACGLEGTSCCHNDGSPNCVSEDLTCRAEVCTVCGDEGEACCDEVRCNDGLTCDSRGFFCERCGEPGNICCPGDTCNGADLVCSAGDCKPCGALGQYCCANDTCDAGLECRGACLLPAGGLTRCRA